MNLLLNPKTEKDIQQLLKKPSHAIIIEGKPGSGKHSIASLCATTILQTYGQSISDNRFVLSIKPVKNSISIDTIRNIQNFLKLKTIGKQEIRRAIIIEHAELMTIEAQNALLKVLEEPPADTIIFILTSQKIKLLPTLISRCLLLQVLSIPKSEIIKYFTQQGHADEQINSAYHASNKQIGTMSLILNTNDDENPIMYIKQAKKLIAMTQYERLAQVDYIVKQKEEIPNLLSAMVIICRAAINTTLENNNIKQAKRWHKNYDLVLKTELSLSSNPNPKLLLTNLFLNL